MPQMMALLQQQQLCPCVPVGLHKKGWGNKLELHRMRESKVVYRWRTRLHKIFWFGWLEFHVWGAMSASVFSRFPFPLPCLSLSGCSRYCRTTQGNRKCWSLLCDTSTYGLKDYTKTCSDFFLLPKHTHTPMCIILYNLIDKEKRVEGKLHPPHKPHKPSLSLSHKNTRVLWCTCSLSPCARAKRYHFGEGKSGRFWWNQATELVRERRLWLWLNNNHDVYTDRGERETERLSAGGVEQETRNNATSPIWHHQIRLWFIHSRAQCWQLLSERSCYWMSEKSL